MPKMKTHRAAAKRFRVTGSGKLIRRKTFKKHLLEHKNSSRKRRLSVEVVVDPANRQNLAKELPYHRYLR